MIKGKDSEIDYNKQFLYSQLVQMDETPWVWYQILLITLSGITLSGVYCIMSGVTHISFNSQKVFKGTEKPWKVTHSQK